MGKENAEVRRASGTGKAQAVLISKTNLQKELTKHWSLHRAPVSSTQIVEDGFVVVIVRTPAFDIKIVCKGLANEGNAFTSLVKVLKRQHLISKHDKIDSFFVRRAFAWEAADPTRDKFRSGDCLMAVVRPETAKVRKTIVRPANRTPLH